MIRVLVFGKNGQLATALAKASSGTDFQLKFVSSSEFDLIAQITDISDFISKMSSIDCVINASAFTNVDKAEMQNSEAAWILNALAPEEMAKACKDREIPFFHISTDCVFDGESTKPYLPYCAKNPVNFYGATKLEGERLVQALQSEATIFRTSWVFSNTGHNFVHAMLNIAQKNKVIQVVNDQIGLPTYAPDLANALLETVRYKLQNPSQKFEPIYHIAGGGKPITRYDFAKFIVQLSDLETKVEPISSKEFAAIAPRPKNAVLDTENFTSTFGINLPDWQVGLKQMLSKAE